MADKQAEEIGRLSAIFIDGGLIKMNRTQGIKRSEGLW